MKKILIASTNNGKILVYSVIFNRLGLETISLRDLKVDVDVEENGKDELENAIIKAKAYNKITGLPVLANDSGLIIDKFKPEDQPGQFVRRFEGKELTDEDLLSLYIDKLNEVGGESSGHFKVALALIDDKGQIHTKTFYPKRYFINKPSSIMNKGVPLNSITYDFKSKKYMSEMTPQEKIEYEEEAMEEQAKFIESIFRR